jgi:hypothetical protein
MWFVHLGSEPPLPPTLERTAGLGGSSFRRQNWIISDGTWENLWDKIIEIIKLGFIPVDAAKEVAEKNGSPIRARVNKNRALLL